MVNKRPYFFFQIKKTWKVIDYWNNSFLVDNIGHSNSKRESLHIGNTSQLLSKMVSQTSKIVHEL